MSVSSFYVRFSNIYVDVDAGRIIEIKKNTKARITSHAIWVERLGVTSEPCTIVKDDVLLLDAWAFTDFSAWLYSTMSRPTVRKLETALSRHFAGCTEFNEVTTAICQIVFASKLKRPPQGEETYFVAKALASNPHGFAALAAAGADSH